MAIRDLRGGYPRRPCVVGPQALGVPGARGPRRRRHLSVHDLVTDRRLRGGAGIAAHPRLSQLHRRRVLRRLGTEDRRTGGESGGRAGAAGAARAARLGQERVQRAGLAFGGLPAHRRRPGAGGLPARHRDARPDRGRRAGAAAQPGWRRHPLRGPGRAVEGAARIGQGAVDLPAALRHRGQAPPRGRNVELRVPEGGAGFRPRPWAQPGRPAAAVHRACTDQSLRAALVEAGHRRAAALSGGAASRAFVDSVAGVVGRP